MDTTAPASPTAAPAKRPPLKWYWRALRVAGLAYVGILIFLYVFQRKLIFPGAGSHGDPAANITAPPGCELLALKTAGGVNVKALFGPAFTADGKIDPAAKSRPTILFCYGNAMSLHTALQQFNAFRHMGANVIIPEYAGYGMSDGEAGETGCYAAADAAYEHLLTRSDIDPSKIIISGWSLGGAVAIDLASRKPAAGLATFSTFTSMAGMGHSLYPFLPAFAISGILHHHFESASKIPQVHCPILIGHGTADRMIPFAMSDQLAAAATGTVTRLSVDGAGHEDFFSHDGAKVSAAFAEFVGTCCGK
jgi:pimeloyl-ACP methyl ester carboxylesterase